MKKIFFLLTALLTAMTAWADVEINETNFPDENFRAWLLSQEYGKDGKLTNEEIANIGKIDVSYMNIQSLKGIEYFTELDALWCFRCQLTSLDVSNNTALGELHCYGNQLKTLDVSRNTALVWLSCHDNKLTTLDVSKNSAITELCCGQNPMTSLDVSGCTALVCLDCSGSQLKTLDVSRNTALAELYCYQNQITGTGMDALIESLPSNIGMLYVIYDEDEQNEMTTTQVAAATAKGWTPMYFDGKLWSEYAGNEQTGITSLESSHQGKDTIYNLGGQRLNRLTKGLNIMNGQKVLVK